MARPPNSHWQHRTDGLIAICKISMFWLELEECIKPLKSFFPCVLRSWPTSYDRRDRWGCAVWLLQTQLCILVACVRPIYWVIITYVHVILYIYHTVIKHAGNSGFWCTSITLRQRQPKNPEMKNMLSMHYKLYYAPCFFLRLWRFINHLLTYLLKYLAAVPRRRQLPIIPLNQVAAPSRYRPMSDVA